MSKSLLFRSIIVGLISWIVLYGVFIPKTMGAGPESEEKFCVAPGVSYDVVKTINMMVTAYSSTIDQTDSTPFITASGKKVVDGIVANNMLPFGSKIRIPQLYGEKVFTVQDRMHERKGKYHVDIWFPEYKQAKRFGAKILKIEILES